ncbi:MULTISPECIES: hypothetical protein [Mycobacteriaceae]|jgi:hypothetical protein|uniref:Uncharacterized protein n=4 Tax=Mycobacterium TaxID=1763 RepID=A0A1V3WN17_MYCKA|nr:MULTISPECIES: hypothetical protein [Mycobacteriaceae]ETA92029.1 hypothetical protein O982_24640 [Mycobacterium avium 10-5581]ETZ54005.1 hypothetical protein L839_0667 [Mycobacterium avium MAV_120809_2495]ETZ56302.1 hypothetical protein L838_0510 [Mycobacterium avium MAV_120709_2344]EUA05664.1 hypothetical protein I547_1133 [Mycobacterium kansasii 824]EUA14382.1 hypothetical protein I546_0180 [Mycobacterium kansasii 732]KDP06816.1 hypothetical protein MAV100_15940 [Mycobacterium avium subsp
MVSPQPHTAKNVRDERSYSREEFTEWLTESCERQQVSVAVTNPTVLADIAMLLR